jgi:transcriptional regulator with XRE-family HTH domain
MAVRKLKRRGKDEEPAKLGRQPIYDYTFPRRAYRMTLLGATLEDLAVAFDVTKSSVEKWIQKHPEFIEAIKRGRIDADANVAEALYKRATGFTKREERIFSTKNGEIVRGRVRRYYAPDVGAATRWLSVRKPDLWAPPERHEHGGIPGGVPVGVGLRDESKAELIASILNMIHPKPDPE